MAALAVAALIVLGLTLAEFPFSSQQALAAAGASPSASNPPWTMTTPYPAPIYMQSCATALGYIYCVGGVSQGPSDFSEFAPVSAAGIGAWQNTTSYPEVMVSGTSTAIVATSCVASSSDIYCVGGITAGGTQTNSTYFAPHSGGGIGSWTATTPYPTGVNGQSCVLASQYIYCVGGQTATNTGTDVYSAPVSSSGIGSWTAGPLYPYTSSSSSGENAPYVSCAAASSDVYCVGGAPPTNEISAGDVYYAQLSGGGVGAWQTTTNFPVQAVGTVCTAPGAYLICAGGFTYNGQTSILNATFFAPITATGIGTWQQSGLVPSVMPSCASESGYVYCVGGFELGSSGSPTETPKTYYASISALTTVGVFSSFSTTYTSSSGPQTPCLEGFDFSPGGAFGQYLYAGSLCTGQIFRIAPNGASTLWAYNLTSVADIQFVRTSSGEVVMYFVNAQNGELQEIVPCGSGCSTPGLPPGYQKDTNATGLNFPKGIASPPYGCNCSGFGNGQLYVAESGSGEILNYSGGTLAPFASVGSSEFPVGMAFGNGSFGDYLYVGLAEANSTSYGIVRIAPNGTVDNFALKGMAIAPVAIDPPGYSPGLYAGEYLTGQIWKVDPNGTASLFMSLQSTQVRYMKFGPAAFGGQMYYTDYNTGNVYVVSSNGTPTMFAQTAGAQPVNTSSSSSSGSSTSSSASTTSTASSSSSASSSTVSSSSASHTSVSSSSASYTTSTQQSLTTVSSTSTSSSTSATSSSASTPTTQSASSTTVSTSSSTTTTTCNNCTLYTPSSLVGLLVPSIIVILAVALATFVRKRGGRTPVGRAQV